MVVPTTPNRTAVINPEENSPREIEVAPKLTKQSISTIKEQMDLAEELVTNLMKLGIDYGQTPGTNGLGLWDAGSAKVIRAFRLYPNHTVLHHEENDEMIHYTIQVHLVNSSGEIFGSGMGAASTRETKYKYRWVKKADALREGYTEEDLKELKTKAGYNNEEVLYRIENPEYGELVNTILAMACKRAEVDAARGLPGVGSALRAKFDEKPGARKAPAPDGHQGGQEDLSLAIFWSMVKGAGLSEDDVHNTLKVKSLKDWKEAGKSYRDAVIFIMNVAVSGARGKKESAKKTPQSGTTPAPKVEKTAAELKEADIPTLDELIKVCDRLWKLPEIEIFQELGYASSANFEEAQVSTAWEAFLTLKEIKQA